MTITVELAPETAEQLRTLARARGQDLHSFAVAALTEIAERAEADFEEACAGIAKGLADGEAGREISFEEYRAQWEAEKAARRAQREAA